MAQTSLNTTQEEWLKVLGKGMITLPKKWRDDMGIENGDIVKAKKEGEKIVIEPASQAKPAAPYRVYTTEEINDFLEADILSDELTQKVQKTLVRKPIT
jgi:AbrB family looped-hinge helix DNA binding protein